MPERALTVAQLAAFKNNVSKEATLINLQQTTDDITNPVKTENKITNQENAINNDTSPANSSTPKLLPTQALSDLQADAALNNLILKYEADNSGNPNIGATFDGLTKQQVSAVDLLLNKISTNVHGQIKADGITNPVKTENKITNQENAINNDTSPANSSTPKLLPTQALTDLQADAAIDNLILKYEANNSGNPNIGATFDGLTKAQVDVIEADLAKESANVHGQIKADGITNPVKTENKITWQENAINNDTSPANSSTPKLLPTQALTDLQADAAIDNLILHFEAVNSGNPNIGATFNGLTASQVNFIGTLYKNVNTLVQSQIAADGITNPVKTENKITRQENAINNDLQTGKITQAQATSDESYDATLNNLILTDEANNSGNPTIGATFNGLTKAQVAVIDTDLANEQAIIKSQIK